jgi:hypothetical protein
MLPYVIEANYKFLKHWYIVTDKADYQTQDICRNFPNIEVLFYEFKTERHSFNKGGAVRYAQQMANEFFPNEYKLLLDSDVCLPPDFKKILNAACIEEGPLYGATRRIVPRLDHYITDKKFNYPLDVRWNLEERVIGFFQLYKSPLLYDDSYNCAEVDLTFAAKFESQQFLPIVVDHIGVPGVNWNGRASSSFKRALTVVISCSYLDAHPSIKYIKNAIESLDFMGISEDTLVILSHDGLKQDDENYEEKRKRYDLYFENLENYIKESRYTSIKIVKAENWGHLTRSLKNAMSYVSTKYVLVMQHDLHMVRNVPVYNLLGLMESYRNIKHLRFNSLKNIPIYEWWDGFHRNGASMYREEEYDGIKVCATPAWSDQNHITTKEYYDTVVFPDCTNPDGELMCDFMENRLNILCHRNHKRYGTYIYGGYNTIRTVVHADGRNSSAEEA